MYLPRPLPCFCLSSFSTSVFTTTKARPYLSSRDLCPVHGTIPVLSRHLGCPLFTLTLVGVINYILWYFFLLYSTCNRAMHKITGYNIFNDLFLFLLSLLPHVLVSQYLVIFVNSCVHFDFEKLGYKGESS